MPSCLRRHSLSSLGIVVEGVEVDFGVVPVEEVVEGPWYSFAAGGLVFALVSYIDLYSETVSHTMHYHRQVLYNFLSDV